MGSDGSSSSFSEEMDPKKITRESLSDDESEQILEADPETKVVRTDTTTVETKVEKEEEEPVVTEREVRIDPTLPKYNQHTTNVDTKNKKGSKGETSAITTTTIQDGLNSKTIVETKTTSVTVVNKGTGNGQKGEKKADEKDGGDNKVVALCCVPIPCTIL